MPSCDGEKHDYGLADTIPIWLVNSWVDWVEMKDGILLILSILFSLVLHMVYRTDSTTNGWSGTQNAILDSLFLHVYFINSSFSCPMQHLSAFCEGCQDGILFPIAPISSHADLHRT